MTKVVTFSVLALRILELKYPGLKTKGLRKELRSFLPRYLYRYYDNPDASENFDVDFSIDDCVEGAVTDLLRKITFIPDAFRIIEEEGEIQLFEVEDTHKLTIEKLKLLAGSWTEFEENGLKLRLFISDRYGANIRELDLDLYEELLWSG
ncbi:MAG: hypothetical protein ACR65R_03765 [Methylomicrobium sp.]